MTEPDQASEACCGLQSSTELGEQDAVALAELLRVLADPARLRILALVAGSTAGELCACHLIEPLGRSQPTVSHHLSTLVDAGFLTREKRGRWAWYRAAPEPLRGLRAALDAIGTGEMADQVG